jgi:ABC-type cobalamin/Fe3+-siderophores transport system ATPase subunit
MPHPFLDYTLEGFRCFRDLTEFRQPRHVNVICGPNNSGKSTLLLPLRRITTTHHPVERPYHGRSYLGGDQVDELRFKPKDISHESQAFKIVFHQAIDGDAVLVQRAGARSLEFGHPDVSPKPGADGQTQEARKRMCAAIAEHGRAIVYIPATRRVQPILHEGEVKSAGESIFDGSQVLPKILEYANSPREGTARHDGRHPKLVAIETTMSDLLAQKVQLRPLPADKDIELTIDGRHVALSRSGTGIEQLLVFSVALVEYPEFLLLIEEPENFLHPTLQRRIMQRLLQRKGDSVVTTHSNHLLDIRDNRIAYYRTFMKPGESSSAGVERIDSQRKYQAIWDLGVRPSSLFESNATIWVEGPSDAIYIRTWLSFLPAANGLIEGIHYTFAFHAGALLDKFFVDPEGGRQPPDSGHVVDFFALHPNFFIVADSDGDGSKAIGHAYLQRLIDQPKIPEVLWVTHGKEIENYLPLSVLGRYLETRAIPRQAVVTQPTPEERRWTPFWKTLNTIANTEVRTEAPNKVEFAEWACGQLKPWPEGEDPLDVFDLRGQLERMVAFIRRATGEDAAPIAASCNPISTPEGP